MMGRGDMQAEVRSRKPHALCLSRSGSSPGDPIPSDRDGEIQIEGMGAIDEM
jgi:hypothetical protein